jgi:hypothetical protein
LLLAIGLSFAGSARAQAPLQTCTICHAKPDLEVVTPDGRTQSLYVDEKVLHASVHAKKTCKDCHRDVVEIPHREHKPAKVQCTLCHYKGNPEGAPQSDAYLAYAESIHGVEAAKGNPKAPLCQDCHGSHDVRHAKDPAAHVSKLNVAETCGRCHVKIYGEYLGSIHGVALLEKHRLEAPACTDCHGEHNIYKKDNPASKVYATNVSKTCSACHANQNIVGKFGIETEQVATYAESFHGIAGKFGAKTVANCASCHGVHNILPPDDPRSSVNLANIPKTCGKCHPGAGKNFARGKIHLDANKSSAGLPFYVKWAFTFLTGGTMAALIIHILLDLRKKIKLRREAKDGNLHV